MTDALTVRYLVDLYCRHKLSTGSPQTRYQYQLNVNRLAEFLEREPLLSDLQDTTVGQAAYWLQRTKRLSPASASKFLDCILAAWRFGSRKRIEGIIGEPDIPAIQEPKRIPVAWTRHELAQLWAYMKRMPGDVNGIAASDWFCSLIACLYDTGERIGAMMATEWCQVDMRGRWIVVRAEVRKGGLADKLSRLHPNTIELLERIRFPERKRIWEWPWHRDYLWKVYDDILRRAGLPHGRDRKFHCIRKSTATHIAAIAGEGAAQSALGHSDIRMTRDVYCDPRQIKRDFPADILPRFDAPDDGPKAA